MNDDRWAFNHGYTVGAAVALGLVLMTVLTHSPLLLCIHSNGTIGLKQGSLRNPMVPQTSEEAELRSPDTSSCFDLVLTVGHFLNSDDHLQFLRPLVSWFVIALLALLATTVGVQALLEDAALSASNDSAPFLPFPRRILSSTVLLL